MVETSICIVIPILNGTFFVGFYLLIGSDIINAHNFLLNNKVFYMKLLVMFLRQGYISYPLGVTQIRGLLYIPSEGERLRVVHIDTFLPACAFLPFTLFISS